MGETGQIRLLRIAVGVSFILAIVNHLLPPKAWAATQLLFDYQFGLIRRGLAGEILTLFTGPTMSAGEAFAASAVITLIGAFTFYVFLTRAAFSTVAGLLLAIIALNSYAYASFVGNTGYLDALLLALALVAIGTDGTRMSGLVARILAAILGAMLHENMLPYFTLLIGFDLWLARGGTRKALAMALLPMVAALITVIALNAIGQFSPNEVMDFAAYLTQKSEFVAHPDVSKVAGRGIGGNLALMVDLWGTTKYWAWVLFDGVPLLAMSVWLIWIGLRLIPARDHAGRMILLAVILAPLSLNIIAFDVVRFGTASVLAGFVALCLILRHRPETATRFAAILSWPHAVLVLVLNANMFTIQINTGAGHTSQFPWVLVTQLQWLTP